MTHRGSSTPSDPEKWKEFHTEMIPKMRVEKLKEAMKRCERPLLEVAIKEAKEAGINPENDYLVKAEAELELVGVREELQKAVEERITTNINEVMMKITRDRFYMSRLHPNMVEAQRVLDDLQRLNRLGSYILDMDRKTMGEMRRYHHPPPLVHHIMQAVLLLFKYDEDSTQKWHVCQEQLHPNGPKGMSRRVLNFDVTSVHPEVAARVAEILDVFDLNDVQKVSPGVATFYVWARGVLEETESHNKQGTKVKPADIKRQKEIFAPVPVESPRRRRKPIQEDPAGPIWK